jgi:excisionase family DNA binding protein
MKYNNPFETIDIRLNEIERLLIELKYRPADSTDGDLLTVKQTADFLDLSVKTIYNLISRQELPVTKRGKRCYFFRQDLIDFLKSGRRYTLSEIANGGISAIQKKGGIA